MSRFMKLGLSAYKKIIILSLIAIILLVLPQIIRFYYYNNDNLVGDYYSLRVGESLLNKIYYDSVNERVFYPIGTGILLALFSLIFKVNSEISARILPILLGILSLILFYLLLKHFNYNSKLRYLTSLALIISPGFLFLFSTVNNFAFPIFISLLALYLYLKNLVWLSFILILFNSLFSILSVFILLFLAFIYIILKDRKLLKKFWKISLILILLSIIIRMLLLRSVNVFTILEFDIFSANLRFLFQNFVSEFGGIFGLSIFTYILLFLGIYFSRKEKKRFNYIYLIFILLFLIAFKLPWVLLYLNFLIMPLVGYALVSLLNLEWESTLIKKLTLIILVVGLIFSGFSYINFISVAQPIKETTDGLEFLEALGFGKVLSHYSRGDWITYFSKKPIVIDSSFYTIKDINNVYRDVNTIFYTRDLKIAEELLNKYDIRYIVIDKEMKDGLVWSEREEGLLFLLRFSTKFKKAYSKDIEIWEYIR